MPLSQSQNPSPSLGEEINAVTRPLHTTLNRLILTLFPLALPPHTPSPHLYARGLSLIQPIYRTIESSLHRHLSTSAPSPLLQNLHIPALYRASRLKADLSLLLGPLALEKNLSYPPRLRCFLQHITTATASKPHLLLAYIWVLYLALFSGGRYLRAQLRIANLQAWHLGAEPDAPLQFWGFEGECDGEDLKADFKERVRGVEDLLTGEERREVIDEGKEVMRRMLEVVREIEEIVGGGLQRRGEEQDEDVIFLRTKMLLHRFLLPLGLLKGLGSWSWRVAAGVGAGFGFWGTVSAAA